MIYIDFTTKSYLLYVQPIYGIPIPPGIPPPPIPLPGISSYFLSNFIMSSILKIVIAASVANLKFKMNKNYLMHFTFETKGSRTPALTLSLILPKTKSSPIHLYNFYFSS